MRILHVTNVYPDEMRPGYGVFVKEQIESLCATSAVENDVLYVDVGTLGRTAYLHAFRHLRRVGMQYDVVHAHHLFSAVIAIFAGLRSRMVVSFLGGKFDMVGALQWLGGAVFWLVRALVPAVIVKQPLKVARPNVFFIPNGIDTERFDVKSKGEARRRLGCKSTDLVILFVSAGSLDRKEKRKNLFDDVASALERCSERRVVPLYMSNTPRDMVVDYFNAADCHLLTSDFEGSPNSVKEALACGCPVVARAVGDVPRLLREVPFCLLFSTDGDAMSRGLIDHIAGLNGLTECDRVKVRRAFLRNASQTGEVAKRLCSVYALVCGEAWQG